MYIVHAVKYYLRRFGMHDVTKRIRQIQINTAFIVVSRYLKATHDNKILEYTYSIIRRYESTLRYHHNFLSPKSRKYTYKAVTRSMQTDFIIIYRSKSVCSDSLLWL